VTNQSIGSSNGRGPRCAGWFADYVAQRGEQEGLPESMVEPRVYTLDGGIKGWVAGGPPYRAIIDSFDENYWMQFAEVKTAGKRTMDTSMDDAEEEWTGNGDDGAKRVRG
jgi:arsenical-resistance protein 2